MELLGRKLLPKQPARLCSNEMHPVLVSPVIDFELLAVRYIAQDHHL